MAESSIKRLLVQTSHYSVSSIATMLAGLITFPILTRIFSVADYGVMNLIGATLSVSVAIGKMGIQHSIIRYESEIRAGKGRFTLPQLYSTTMLGMFGSAIIVLLVIAVGAQVVPASWLGGADPRLRHLFGIASVLVVVQVLDSVTVNFLRAEQQTKTIMTYQVLKKYLGIGIILGSLYLITKSLTAFYTASVISEGICVAALAWVLFHSGHRSPPKLALFSRRLYVELLGFGIPMMIGYEISGIVLSVGDRYVIDGMIGPEPLGLYSAAYNLCTYVQGVFIASMSQAIVPIYIRLWDTKGPEETSGFIDKSLRTYALIAAPLIAGVAAVGPELLTSLASDKYASGGLVLSWVIAGMVLDGSNSIVGAGLFIQRKTKVIMSIVFGTAVLNIVLNIFLVPRMGILGAAISTLVSYAATGIAMGIAGRRILPVRIPYATIARAGVASAIMYLALRNLFPGHKLITVGVRATLGVPMYAVMMGAVDPEARALVRKALERFKRPSKPPGEAAT